MQLSSLKCVALAFVMCAPAWSQAQTDYTLLSDTFTLTSARTAGSTINGKGVECGLQSGTGTWSAASTSTGSYTFASSANGGMLTFPKNQSTGLSIPVPAHSESTVEVQAVITPGNISNNYVAVGFDSVPLSGTLGWPTNLAGLKVTIDCNGLVFVYANQSALTLDTGLSYYFIPSFTSTSSATLKLRYNSLKNVVSAFANGVPVVTDRQLSFTPAINYAGIVGQGATGGTPATADSFLLTVGVNGQLGDVFQMDAFDDPNPLTYNVRWLGGVTTSEIHDSGKAIVFSANGTTGLSANSARRPLSSDVVAAMVGRKVSFSLKAKGTAATNVVAMLCCTTTSGSSWLSIAPASGYEGTYDWKNFGWRTTIPSNTTAIDVYLGFGSSTNSSARSIAFDDLRVEADPIVLLDRLDDATFSNITSRWIGATLTRITDTGYSYGVQITGNSGGTSESVYALPSATSKDLLNLVRGHRVLLTARVKANAVTRTTDPAQGIQVNLRYTSGGVVTDNRAPVHLGFGQDTPVTTDWMSVCVPLVIPENATAASIVLGLNNSVGTAWFDNVQIEMNPSVFFENFSDQTKVNARFSGGSPNVNPSVPAVVTMGDKKAMQLTNAYNYKVELPVAALRDRCITLRAQLRSDAAGTGPTLLCVCYTLSGGVSGIWSGNVTSLNPGVNLSSPPYDWTDTAYSVYLPANAVQATLYLGAPGYSSGTLSVANIRIDTMEANQVDWTNPTPYPAFSGNPSNGQLSRGMNMSVREISLLSTMQSEINLLRTTWKSNTTRWQLGNWTYPVNGACDPNLSTQVNTALSVFDALTASYSANSMPVSLCMYGAADHLFDATTSSAMTQGHSQVVAKWREIAARYRNNTTVWAYDIANEPVDWTVWRPSNLNWNELAEQIVNAIREVDPDKPIIVSCANNASPEAMKWLRPVRARNIIYQIHCYLPLCYTHQGVMAGYTTTYSYPGTMSDNLYWDKSQIETALQPVVQFQNKYKVPIYVGEFSVVRWAPNGSAYLKDVTDVFESHQWGAVYWHYRDGLQWDLEVDDNHERTQVGYSTYTTPPYTTTRGTVIRAWLNNNP